MPVRAANWYNLQAQRRYPLDDTATGTDDTGVRLRDSILADLQLRFPETAGQYAYVGGITVTARIVTIMLLAADSPDAETGFVPLAALTLQQPVVENRHYALDALYPGVGGWVVFSNGVREAFTGRFSSPQQALVTARCAKPYRVLPIPTLGKLFRDTALSGLVTIKAGSDLEIVKEDVEIAGLVRESLVFRLTQAVANRNTLEVYVSPCSTRPESGTCEKDGVEFFNSVAPDCDGNINIEFVGLTPGPYESCGAGVTVDHQLGLEEVCPPTTIGDQHADLCGSASAEDDDDDDDDDDEEEEGGGDDVSSSAITCLELPHCEGFDTQDITNFFIKSGSFVFGSEDSPTPLCGAGGTSYATNSGSTQSVTVFEDCSYETSFGKRCTVDLQLTDVLAKRNGGIVINYHIIDEGLATEHVEYFIASLDLDVGKLQLLRYNGQNFVTEFSSSLLPLVLSHWYRLQVTTSASGDQGVMAVVLSGVSDPGFAAVSFTVSSSNYLPDDGHFGIGANKAHTRFSYFQLEEFP